MVDTFLNVFLCFFFFISRLRLKKDIRMLTKMISTSKHMKSIVFGFKQVFWYFSVTNVKKERKKIEKPPLNSYKRESTSIYFNAETNGFDQQMACGAPVCWSKYITNICLPPNQRCSICCHPCSCS